MSSKDVMTMNDDATNAESKSEQQLFVADTDDETDEVESASKHQLNFVADTDDELQAGPAINARQDFDIDIEDRFEIDLNRYPIELDNLAHADTSYQRGGWENDETVEQAAVREALEEAGVRGDLMVSLGEYDFKSKTLQGKSCPQGLCKAELFALHVKEELLTWPEQSARGRTWLTVSEALDCCYGCKICFQ